jgi:hypothetical protein
MKLKLALAVLSLCSLAAGVTAMTIRSMSAYVVSVDAKAKSITLKHSVEDGKKWEESVYKWDDETTWARADKNIFDETPATADVAKTLKKDDKVRVELTMDGGSVHLDKLKTLPATAEVH